MTLNTSVVISFLFSEGIIVATVRNRNEEKSSHFLSYFFRIQFHNTKYKKIGSRIFFEKMKLSRDHHPYLACVSAFVRKPFERRSWSSISFCFISKYREPIWCFLLCSFVGFPLVETGLTEKVQINMSNTKMIIRFLQKHNRTQQRG